MLPRVVWRRRSCEAPDLDCSRPCTSQGVCSASHRRACRHHIIDQRNVMAGYFWMSPKPILRGHEAFFPAQLMLRRSVAPVPEPRPHHHRRYMTGSDRLS